MDRKSIAILALCLALFFAWPVIFFHFFPAPPQATNSVARVTAPASVTNQATTASGTAAPSAAAIPSGPNNPSAFITPDNVPEQSVSVTNDNARYVFSSRGGGLAEVELFHYPETVHARRHQPINTNNLATLNNAAVPPVLTILGSGADTLQDDGSFQLSTPTKNSVRAEKTLSDGLTIVKDFQVGTNYLVNATVRLENHSDKPLNLPAQHWVIGAATPMGSQDNPLRTLEVKWFNGVKPDSVTLPYFNTNTSYLFVFQRTPKSEYHAGDSNVMWVSAQNQFFTLATMPVNPAPAMSVHMVDLPEPSQEEIATEAHTLRAPKGLEAALDYPAQTLAPGQSVERTFNLYTGPKEYHVLAQINARFNNQIDLIMGFNGFIGNIAKFLLWGMNLIHDHGVAYGWCIVLITVFLKLVFWPLTQYSMKSMKRMQALQPEMKKLQEKYKDDPQELSRKQMEFWKKNKVNPLSGCLPMLLQLPLLWGFYRMLLSAIELRGTHFLWIADLSKPDTIFSVPIPPLFGIDLLPINPMPLIMGVTMLWQSHLTPPSPGVDPAQQKMMRYMPLMFLVFMYNLSSGLALYWTVQNLLSILQTKLIQNTDLSSTGGARKPVTVSAPPKKIK